MIGSVHAILLADDKYVLQLRDDKPTIAFPGVWSLFGGVLEEETPKSGMIRELHEELSILVEDCRFLWNLEHHSDFLKEDVLFYFFEADITHLWGRQILREGQAVGRFPFQELRRLSIPGMFLETLEIYHKKKTVPCSEFPAGGKILPEENETTR